MSAWVAPVFLRKTGKNLVVLPPLLGELLVAAAGLAAGGHLLARGALGPAGLGHHPGRRGAGLEAVGRARDGLDREARRRHLGLRPPGVGGVELVEVGDVVAGLLAPGAGGDRLEDHHRDDDGDEHEDEPGHGFPFRRVNVLLARCVNYINTSTLICQYFFTNIAKIILYNRYKQKTHKMQGFIDILSDAKS